LRVFAGSDLIWFFVIVIGAAFAVLAWLAAKREEQRRQALAALAASRGLAFNKADPVRVPGTFAQFELFQRGDTRYAYNVIHGVIEARHYCACDFQYTVTTYTTDDKGNMQRRDVTTYCSAAIAELNCPVPAVWLRSENLLDKAAAMVGFTDLEFESDEFNRAFHVKAVDREIAFDIINAQTMQRLLAGPFRNIEFNGAAVLVFEETTWTPEQVGAALDFARSMAEGLPHYLFEKLRERMQGET
jgi:hypothetical protein